MCDWKEGEYLQIIFPIKDLKFLTTRLRLSIFSFIYCKNTECQILHLEHNTNTNFGLLEKNLEQKFL